jgi:hypothetical protein
MMIAGFTVMIQKQSNNHCSGRAKILQEQKSTSGPEFNKEHNHFFLA